MRVTVVEHLAYHLMFKGRASEIGLKECQNDFAVDMLNRNCVDFLEKIGKLDVLNDEISESMGLLDQILT